MSDDERSFELLMPFVVCESNGGPYDDDAFAAGWHAGTISTRLEAKPAVLVEFVRSQLVPQLDLVAMQRGYRMTAEPWDEQPDEWTEVTFTLA